MTIDRWDKVFKNGPSEICGRQLLMTVIVLLKHTISLQFFKRLSSTNFTWSILEYFVPYDEAPFLKKTAVMLKVPGMAEQ